MVKATTKSEKVKNSPFELSLDAHMVYQSIAYDRNITKKLTIFSLEAGRQQEHGKRKRVKSFLFLSYPVSLAARAEYMVDFLKIFLSYVNH